MTKWEDLCKHFVLVNVEHCDCDCELGLDIFQCDDNCPKYEKEGKE